MAQGRVSISSGPKFERYTLNDGLHTVQDALDQFLRDEELGDRQVFLNGDLCEETDQELRANDVILLISEGLATGGYKQAELGV